MNRPALLLIGLSVVGLSGCGASLKELRHHPQQARLERLLADILPHTKYAEKHYWVRVAQPTKHRIGLTVLPHRHVYLSEDLLEALDDQMVTALLAHGVAHHRLHHYTRRGVVRMLSQAVFKAGGFFVPGLSHGHYVGDPIAEAAFSAGQEQEADEKAVLYLTRMGRSAQDLIQALRVLHDRGYAERVGRLIAPSATLVLRLQHLERLEPISGVL